MPFKVFTSTENGIELLNLQQDGTLVSIVPKHGAMLHEFSITTASGKHNVIDNYSSLEALENELPMSFKSSKLSPFACRIPEGKYIYEGEVFEMTNKFIDGSAIHGLLYNKTFSVVNEFTDDLQASVLLKYNYKEEDDGYPFSYRCEIRYTLLPDNLLQLETTVINLDDLPIPIADGWHPYFKLGGKVNDWLFQFNAGAMVEFDDKLIPTGHMLEYNQFNQPALIKELFLDNCFLLNDDDTYAACTIKNPRNGMQVSFYPEATYPFLQVYTPPHRVSIAIENLSAAPDAFNNKMGLLMLPARHTHVFTVHYQLSCE